ncbi:zinc finger, CCHC-type containing protein [Tanacetum coccineum]
MKSQDVANWKEAVNDEMDSIMGNNNWVLADLPPVARISTIRLLIAMESIHNLIIHQMDVKTSFLNGDLDEEQAPKQWHQKFDEVVLSNGYLLNQADKCVYSKFDKTGKGVIICLYVDDKLIFGTDQVQSHYIKKVLKKFNYFDCTPVSTPMNTSEKLMPNNGKLSKYTSNPDTQHWQAIQRVFLLGGGAISWASKKQTCITGSTMESKFVALAAAGKEAKWLKNLLFKIPLWSKPIAPISICCNSAATLTKAYSQMYNGKSRHLDVRHSMIRELIMNGVISIEFVRSQQNVVDHLTKGLARDLVIKSIEGMGLKSN